MKKKNRNTFLLIQPTLLCTFFLQILPYRQAILSSHINYLKLRQIFNVNSANRKYTSNKNNVLINLIL